MLFRLIFVIIFFIPVAYEDVPTMGWKEFIYGTMMYIWKGY